MDTKDLSTRKCEHPSGLPRGVSFLRAQVFQIRAPRARFGWLVVLGLTAL